MTRSTALGRDEERHEEGDAVRLPEDITHPIISGASLGFSCSPDGTVRDWTPSTNGIYPPVGYLRWSVLDVGNGDSYGYYWPVGKENQEPIVCTTEHDAYRVVPLASTLAGCLRLVRFTQPEITAEIGEVARAFGIRLTGVRSHDNSGAASADALATLDPRSPQLLLAAAREALRTGDVVQGERNVGLALDLLPEYGEAAFVLSQLLRRQQRFAPAAQALLVAISTPLAFSGGYDLRLKCLKALQGMKDDLVTGDDVLWRERQRLTFQTGVKHNDDFLLYEDVIEASFAAGAGIRAVWLRMLVGELMCMETISFQERYGWTPTKHRENLRRDLIRAGLWARLSALEAVST